MEAATAHLPTVRRPRLGRALSDDRLVERLRVGDEVAFEVLYDRYHADLLVFCRHMLGNREEAEDALQHVFVAVHRNLPPAGRDLQLKAWLYTVARNKCLSMLRARRQAVNIEDVPEPEAGGLEMAAEIEHRQDLKDLLTDMARLPDDQRAALVLAELGALSHDDIAAALEVRTDKVTALVFQARESLVGWKQARNADCREIREQLATLHGGALRRAPIRRHLETCAACRDFKAEIRQQRVALAAVLPVVPTLALKQSVLGAALGSSAAASAVGAGAASVAGAGAMGGATVASSAAGGALGSSLLAKGLMVAAVAAGVSGGGFVAVNEATTGPDLSHNSFAAQRRAVVVATVHAAPTGVATPVARGPVQHVPGTPVRRGPVAHSNGRGPEASGNRGRHLGQAKHGNSDVASARGLAHGRRGADGHGGGASGQGQHGRSDAVRGTHRTLRTNSSGQHRPAHARRHTTRRSATRRPAHRRTNRPAANQPQPNPAPPSSGSSTDSSRSNGSGPKVPEVRLPNGNAPVAAPGQIKKD